MNLNTSGPEVNFTWNNNNSKSVFYKCNSCKRKVDISKLREHAVEHNSSLKLLVWSKILKLYSLDLDF